MPLQVDQLGIEFTLDDKPGSSNDNACSEQDADAKKAQEDRLVRQVTARVLAALKREGER